MVYIHVQQTVKDFAVWREGFDNHAANREASGATDEVYVMRNVDSPNEVTVVLGWHDVAKAKAYTQSASLKEAMQKAGVTGPPEIRFLEAAN